MTTHPERAALLGAIRARPDDDTLRLVYADWLDDRGAGDRDAATAEFIRASCGDRPRRAMPRAAYRWLLGATGANWRRLVPGVLARFGAGSGAGCRRGRAVSCALALPGSGRRYAVAFEFERGFVRAARFCSAHAASVVLDALQDDQPLAHLLIAGVRPERARPLASRLAPARG
ncbi:hypothetical protein GobsT_11790 [Gemmata obscuriglobus]|uniref:TIGR02996 domain-containing protein n=1 Tax=Gemmata obscuriglobus TaxID=114 RepID=A0A2Z3HKQ2_9BACT|nr:TIGR02996 domain-containing protein [Gemmata obscuriglobus]AWM42404.1 TIGR02996 domain-containing protein [Gemmata obscuriglobus]QEG26440.1 hypothetical protein GobsT_11790 [Gemmata obscuriglobus]VTS01608.1 unnamed protein product [Gemmata obscuriglobus UQM 2246]